MKYLLLLTLILLMLTVAFGVNLETVYEWKYFDFDWTPTQKQLAINSGEYIAEACVLYDVDKSPDGRTFVTIVREKGVPASLLTVTDQMGEGGPLLSPYPNWDWYQNKNCEQSHITSVYRVSIIHNHLFVLDCGQIGNDQVCPPQLLIFNLSNNLLIRKVEIPMKYAANENGTGLLVTPIVYTPHGKNVYNTAIVFMADVLGYGLVVWNARTSKFCRIESDFMKPVKSDEVFTIDGQSFSLIDGILPMTIIKEDLFYSALAGDKMYKMNILTILQCSSNINEVNELTELVGTLSGQTGPITSKDNVIIFSSIPETATLCADSSMEINSNNTEMIVQDSKRLQFQSSMKIIKNVNEEVYTVSNRYQRVATNTLNLTEINFRVLKMSLDEIKRDTNCFTPYDIDIPIIIWSDDISIWEDEVL